jgi:phosphatidylglycerophosphate synthase
MKLTQEQIGIAPEALPARHFFRACAIPIVKLLLLTPITANQLSFFGILLAVFRFGLFITGKPYYILLGGVIMFFDKIIDYADGPLARCKGCSLRGIFLDKIHHDFHFLGLFIGAPIGISIASNNFIYLILGGFAVTSYFLSRNVYHYKKIILYENSKKPLKRIKEKEFSDKKMKIILNIKKIFDKPKMYADFIFYFIAILQLYFPIILPIYITFYSIYNTFYFIPAFYYNSVFKEDKK